jgi:hypothetical protein
MPERTPCPDCGAAAEITERFTLASTNGPIAHVALSCTAGHHLRMSEDRLASPAGLLPGLVPHTVQLCIHCRQTPAGFWVSRKNSVVAHRPWCLSCCQELDWASCEVRPFAS